jgi:hypothetical protein
MKPVYAAASRVMRMAFAATNPGTLSTLDQRQEAPPGKTVPGMANDDKMSRRTYMTLKATLETPTGTWVDFFIVKEAVASVAIEHPEWDMDEERTWDEWEGVSDGRRAE